MAPAEAPPLQLHDVWRMLRRRRMAAGIAAALMALAVFALNGILLPPLYRAEVTLTMDRGLKPLSFQGDPVNGLVPEQMVNTQRELLSSQGVLQDALAMGGLMVNPAYGSSADAVSLLRKRLRITVIKNSWVLAVSLDDEDPVRAEAGLQSVLDAFLARQATQSRTRGADDLAYIDAQLADSGRKVQAAIEQERAFRQERGIASTDPDQNHITARIQSLAEHQGSIDERVAANDALIGQVKTADANTDPAQRLAALLRIQEIAQHPTVMSLQKECFALESAESELGVKYLDKHPRLIEARSQLAVKRSQLETSVADARTAVVARSNALHEQRAALVKAQEDLQRELGNYREALVELQRLTLESQALRKVHDQLQARKAELTAVAGYDEQRMKVDGAPRSSPVPRGLGTIPLLALAAVAAAAAAVVGAGIAENLDRTVTDGRQIRETTGLRTLGAIPRWPGLEPLHRSGPHEPPVLADATRAVWTGLRHAFKTPDGCKAIAVVSPCSGDGRTTLSARLAMCMALSGTRVLLVDADFRRPGLAGQLGIARPDGLAQLLAGVPELSPMASGTPNLDVMPGGEQPGNPAELLHSHCLGEWLAHVRGFYDLIVFDTPDLATCSDALLVGEQCDGVILAVGAGTTGQSALASAWQQLTPLHDRVLGAVILRSDAGA
jgi:succinoglycan biosynthesis transport protein ExoP